MTTLSKLGVSFSLILTKIEVLKTQTRLRMTDLVLVGVMTRQHTVTMIDHIGNVCSQVLTQDVSVSELSLLLIGQVVLT